MFLFLFWLLNKGSLYWALQACSAHALRKESGEARSEIKQVDDCGVMDHGNKIYQNDLTSFNDLSYWTNTISVGGVSSHP